MHSSTEKFLSSSAKTFDTKVHSHPFMAKGWNTPLSVKRWKRTIGNERWVCTFGSLNLACLKRPHLLENYFLHLTPHIYIVRTIYGSHQKILSAIILPNFIQIIHTYTRIYTFIHLLYTLDFREY